MRRFFVVGRTQRERIVFSHLNANKYLYIGVCHVGLAVLGIIIQFTTIICYLMMNRFSLSISKRLRSVYLSFYSECIILLCLLH